MVKCAVKMCMSRSEKDDKASGVTFHKVPKDENRREQWIKRIRLLRKETDWLPSTATVVCSKHFRDEDKIPPKHDKGRVRLSDEAVPTVISQTEGASEDPSTIVITTRDCSPIAESSDQGGDDETIELDGSPIGTTGGGDAIVPESEGSSRRHEGYRCDVCRGDIVGFRYACVQCANFDLCTACEARGEHAQHYVLRIPHTKLNSDTRAVIKKIRDQLSKEDVEVSIKSDLKEECHLNEDPGPDPLKNTCGNEVRQYTRYRSDTRAVIQKIRDQLSKEDVEDSIKSELKEECHLNEDPGPDSLKNTCGNEVRQYTRYQVIRGQENEDSSAEIYLTLSEETDQQVTFTVQSHPPTDLGHQSQAAKDESYQPAIKSQHSPVRSQLKRLLTFEDSETYVELDGGVVFKEEVGAEDEGRSYAVYTHCADDGGGASATEPLPSSQRSVPSRAKRKK